VSAPRRGGVLDLALVVLVAGVCWTRTPLGGLADRVVDRYRGVERSLPSLTSYFVTGPPPEIAALAEAVIAEGPSAPPPPAPPEGAPGYPEPWRTAAAHALEDEQAVADLDALHALHGASPELTLAIYALGEEQVARAVRRARSAGEADPERYAAYRRYLAAEQARLADAAVTGTLALATVLDLGWPVDAAFAVSSDYGERVDPVTGKTRFHNGVDLAVPVGTSVHAPRDGAVSAATEDGISGRYIVLDHGHGVLTSYCHLSEHQVAAGDEVALADPIGLSGNTGRSTGPHLHYVVRVGGRTVDPASLRRPPES